MAQRKRIKRQFEQYNEALNTLEEALNIKVPSVLERDGTIQRFEYTYELFGKLLKQLK